MHYLCWFHSWLKSKVTKNVEMRGIEPRAFHMQSERSTTELHPPRFQSSFAEPNFQHGSSENMLHFVFLRMVEMIQFKNF